MIENKLNNNNFWSNRFTWDLTIAIVIVMLPILLYTHLLFNSEESTIITLGIYTYDHGFNSLQGFTWFVLSMLIPLLLFIIWFLKSHDSWKYFILSPISLFLFVLIKNGLIQTKSDNLPFLYVMLSTGILMGILIYFDRKINKMAMISSQVDVTSFENFSRNNKYLYHDLLQYTSHLDTTKKKYSKQNHLEKLYSAQQVLDAEMEISIQKVKGRKKIRHVFELISSMLLLCVPILYNIDTFIPEGLKTYQLGWIEIHDHGFNGIDMFLWYISLKLCVLIPLMIWFISSKNWWRYAILAPIILYSFQIWETVQSTTGPIDQFELVKAFPAILFIVGLILFSSYFIKYRYKIFDIYLDITNEINDIVGQLSSSNEIVIEKKAVLDQLKETRVSEVTAAERMDALLKLKEFLIAELDKKKEK